MKKDLENALKSVDPLPSQDMGIVGTWTLEHSPDVATDAISIIAEQSGEFDSYGQFKRCFNSNPPKPQKPSPDDPIFDPPGVQYDSPLERQVAKLARFDNAQKTYETENAKYQTRAASADRIRSSFDHSSQGYVGYAHAEISALGQSPTRPQSAADLEAFLKKKRSLPIAESTARLGTFIVGNHGSGKSEVIKHRIWHYLNKPNPNETIVLIDPHGPLAEEVARMKPNRDNGRLVLFDPFLMAPFVPCMSVLNTQNKSDDNLKFEAEAYGSALEMISGGDMSDNMTSLCRRAAHVTLERDNFNLFDLKKLINVSPPKRGQPERKPPAIYNYAADRSTNFMIRDFFRDNFLYGNFSQAKNGLHERLTRVLEAPIVQRILLNPPKLDFGSLIDQGKVIVVRLPMSQLGDDVTRMLGQMIVAQIQLAVMKRDLDNLRAYPQVHLFMDEAHHFVSPQTAKQIDELRKFGLSLTLATQYIDKFPTAILESVKGLGVQIAGFCAGNNLKEMNSVFGLKKRGVVKDNELDETSILNRLPVGDFYFKVRGTSDVPDMKTRRFSTDTTLLYDTPKWKKENADRYMTDKEWSDCKADQVSKYYRRVENQNPIETLEESDVTISRNRSEIDQEFAKLTPDLGYDD